MRNLLVYTPQLERISKKLNELKDIDKRKFGSSGNQYKLAEPISLDVLEKLEQKNKISLPDCYVAFITTIGNGGAGLAYGLYSIEKSLDNRNEEIDICKQAIKICEITRECHYNLDNRLEFLNAWLKILEGN